MSDCAHDTKHNRQMEKVSPITNVNYVKYLNILTSRLHGQIEIQPVGQREEGEDEGWRQHSLWNLIATFKIECQSWKETTCSVIFVKTPWQGAEWRDVTQGKFSLPRVALVPLGRGYDLLCHALTNSTHRGPKFAPIRTSGREVMSVFIWNRKIGQETFIFQVRSHCLTWQPPWQKNSWVAWVKTPFMRQNLRIFSFLFEL